MAEKTVLLNFEIDTKESVKSIASLRAENKKLTEERNKTNIATEEGREQVLKLNKAIDSNSALIKSNSSALEKQRLNVGNYTDSITDAAKELNVAGVSVGSLSSKLASFANPATIAVGIVGALGAAYARSSIGAKDLEFAQNRLSAITSILTDKFAGLFSSVEDGQGAVSKFVDFALKFSGIGLSDLLFGTEFLKDSEAAALAGEQLNTVLEDREIILGDNAERLGENADLLFELTDKTKTLAERQKAADKIVENSKKSTDDLVASLEAEKQAIIDIMDVNEDKGDMDRKTRAIDKQIEMTKAAATRDQKKAAKALRAALATESAEAQQLLKLEAAALNKSNIELQKRLDLLGKLEDQEINIDFDFDALFDTGTITKNQKNLLEESTKNIEDNLNYQEERTEESNELKKKSNEDYAIESLQSASQLSNSLAGLSEQDSEGQRAAALTTVAINSGIGVSEAVAAGSGVPWPGNLVAILSGISAVLVGITQARSLFAEGGFTGEGGKNEPAGIVHKGEYVVPKHMVESSNYRPMIQSLERGRLRGYTDGGLVTNTSTAPVNQNLLMMNAIKNLPPPELSVKEVTRVANRVSVRQQISRT
jgi:hypothetical protein